MSNEIRGMQAFATPIFTAEVGGFEQHRQGLIDHIKRMKEQDGGRNLSNMGGWQSHDRLEHDTNPHMKWLLSQHLGFSTTCVANSLGNLFTGRLLLQNAWANVNPMHSWNAPHMHISADWSGVAYINVGTGKLKTAHDGDIIFIDPTPFYNWPGRTNTTAIKPVTGMLMLFPGFQLHMVAPHYEDTDRISIAFNYKLI